jgi:hypothetical protein
VALQRTWKQDRVLFFGDDGSVCSLPTAWTDAAEPDAFVAMAAGRAAFRVDDLLVLSKILDGIRRPVV